MDKDKNIAGTSKKIIVFYHDDEDGFTGAWAAWKKLKDKALYISINYGRYPNDYFLQINGKEIYFIDCFVDMDEMKNMAEKNKIILIDHHLSSKEIAKILPGSLHDITRSGAVLSWQYFHPNKKTPRFLLHIEDEDIWKFKLPFTKEISAVLELYDFDFKKWDKLVKIFESKDKKKYSGLVKTGKILLKYQEALINKIIERGHKAVFEGYESFVVNSPVFISEIGHKIYEGTGKVAIVWSHRKKSGNKKIIVSLRSDGKINVAELAEKYGGGGHKAAAGFALEKEIEFPWKPKIDQIR